MFAKEKRSSLLGQSVSDEEKSFKTSVDEHQNKIRLRVCLHVRFDNLILYCVFVVKQAALNIESVPDNDFTFKRPW